MNRSIEIGRFQAVSGSGREYTILVMQDMIDASSHDHPHAEIPGKKSLVTSNGFAVNRLDAETFKIVETDEIVRKV